MVFTGPPPMHPYSPIGGIDISHWQSSVNWETAKSMGVGFVIIRCTYADRADRNYFAHLSSARSNGIPHGVYAYFHPDFDQQKCADKILSVVGRMWPPLGLYIDMEKNPVDNWLPTNTPASVTAQLLKLLSILDTAYGTRDVGIYTSQGWWGQLVVPRLIPRFNLYRRWLWVANWRYSFSNYISYPSLWPRDKVLFHQFSGTTGPYARQAKKFGISGSVSFDADRFLKSMAEFKTLFGTSPAV